MRRNTLSGLRFPSLTYAYVRSRREIRAFLVLLASLHLRMRTVLAMPRIALSVRELQRKALRCGNISNNANPRFAIHEKIVFNSLSNSENS